LYPKSGSLWRAWEAWFERTSEKVEDEGEAWFDRASKEVEEEVEAHPDRVQAYPAPSNGIHAH